MRKKHWFIGIVVLMAAVIGLGSATALAQESDGETSRLGLIARVANILGLQEQQVQDAFDQARQELRDEQFEEMVGQRLDALVESGRITQEQADELREWYAERPDSFWLAGGSARGRKGGGDHGQQARWPRLRSRQELRTVKRIMGDTFKEDSSSSEISLLTRKRSTR